MATAVKRAWTCAARRTSPCAPAWTRRTLCWTSRACKRGRAGRRGHAVAGATAAAVGRRGRSRVTAGDRAAGPDRSAPSTTRAYARGMWAFSMTRRGSVRPRTSSERSGDPVVLPGSRQNEARRGARVPHRQAPVRAAVPNTTARGADATMAVPKPARRQKGQRRNVGGRGRATFRGRGRRHRRRFCGHTTSGHASGARIAGRGARHSAGPPCTFFDGIGGVWDAVRPGLRSSARAQTWPSKARRPIAAPGRAVTGWVVTGRRRARHPGGGEPIRPPWVDSARTSPCRRPRATSHGRSGRAG